MRYFIAAFFAWLSISAALSLSVMVPGPGAKSGSGAAIGTPVTLGVGLNAGSSACSPSTTTQSLTTTANISAGDLVVVGASQLNGSGITVTGVSDGTNTYAKATGGNNGAGAASFELWYKANAAAVGSGATITVTYSSASIYCRVVAARVSGIIAAPLDKTPATTNGTSTTPSISSGTLTQANEILFGTTFVNGTAVYTEGSGFTALDNTGGGSGNVFLYLSTKTVAATTTVTYAPTLGTSRDWGQNLDSFMGN